MPAYSPALPITARIIAGPGIKGVACLQAAPPSYLANIDCLAILDKVVGHGGKWAGRAALQLNVCCCDDTRGLQVAGESESIQGEAPKPAYGEQMQNETDIVVRSQGTMCRQAAAGRRHSSLYPTHLTSDFASQCHPCSP